MPTLEHDGIVELFRDNPVLAGRLIELVWQDVLPPHAHVRVADSSLNQLVPVEFRADLVLELLDHSNKFVQAIVLESQRETDERKKYSWPVYATVSRAERECPVTLLIVAVDEDVAAWAAQPIDLGGDTGRVRPKVLGPQTIPPITDEPAAQRDVELALLSGMAHGNGTNGEQVLRATFSAIATLDREAAMVYFQMLWNVLRAPMRQALQRLVMEQRTSPREFSFVKELFGQDLGDAFRRGEVKGFRDGEVKGFLDAEREKLLRLALRRGLVLSNDQAVRIQTCEERQLLDRWFDNAIDARCADEIFR